MTPVQSIRAALAIAFVPLVTDAAPVRQPAAVQAESAVTHFRMATVDGIDIFYREAGPANASNIVLLHGFPTSSHMFRNLIPELATRYRVIAPDYPAFGQSSVPDRRRF